MTQTEQIKKMKLDDLKPHPENPNMHPPRQIEALAGSIRKYGQYYPIIVDENYTILGGHGKAAALEHLGETEAEVRIISGLTEKQKLKLMLEDNKIQDMSIVSNQKVEELIKSIGDINILGYDENYISILLAEDNKDKINELAVTVKDNVLQLYAVCVLASSVWKNCI